MSYLTLKTGKNIQGTNGRTVNRNTESTFSLALQQINGFFLSKTLLCNKNSLYWIKIGNILQH